MSTTSPKSSAVGDAVEPGSPAAAAGLKRLDILTRSNDQIFCNADQLATLRNVSMTLRHLREEMSVVRELNRVWDRPVFRGVDLDFGRRA